ncbi:hypothetical protein [Nonlabens sp.]|uniref:hypothetical protein n=1 Tax=Nonlabens sp. TaxID=1888209 RepID=UPI003F69DD0D
MNSTLSIVLTFNGFASGDEGIYLDNIEVVANTGAVNPAPSITNITGTPSMPTSSDVVTISADITDTDGIASAVLNWGTTSGNLSNNVTMSSTGNTYTGDIPVQSDGTEVFYRIVATDSNSTPETTTSAEQTYTVLDPQPQGLQIDVVDTKYLIDFDNTVTNVNNGTFDGSGFALVPSTGQLDADAFAISGLEDGTTTFGDEQSGNDFGKGVSDGGVSAGGIYAF